MAMARGASPEVSKNMKRSEMMAMARGASPDVSKNMKRSEIMAMAREASPEASKNVKRNEMMAMAREAKAAAAKMNASMEEIDLVALPKEARHAAMGRTTSTAVPPFPPHLQ